jgi:hypothetical protein
VDCWLVVGRDDGKGYPRIMIEGQRKRMHAWMYELLVGRPDGELDHLCEQPNCVNPWHLTERSKGEHARRHRTNPLCTTCGQLRTVPRTDKPGFRCGPCTSARNRKYREQHRERRIEYLREYRRRAV